MDIIGDRKFVEVPGGKTHELPPLLVKDQSGSEAAGQDHVHRERDYRAGRHDPDSTLDGVVDEEELERRRMDMALNLVDQYLGLLTHWQWGDSVARMDPAVRDHLRRPSRTAQPAPKRPVAARGSQQFRDAARGQSEYPTPGVELEKAVGLRLAFRQMPPIRCCSDQFLFYLNTSVAESAYKTWLNTTPNPIASLPPERFAFEIVNMSLEVH